MWVVEWSQGHELTLLASGFSQHFRRRPVRVEVHWLELDERGGISFDEPLDFLSPDALS
jgi:hypothetical protein